MLASINAQNTKFFVTSPLTDLLFHASRGLTNLHIGKSVRDIYSIAFEFIIILYLIGRLDSICGCRHKKTRSLQICGFRGDDLRIFNYIMISVLHYLSCHIFRINPPQSNHVREYYGQPLYPLYVVLVLPYSHYYKTAQDTPIPPLLQSSIPSVCCNACT